MNERWYAVYTKPRWEKKVSEVLTMKKVDHYCPLNRVIRQWSDRKKVVFVPLFTSYVFVHIHEKQIGELKKLEGILNFVFSQDKPAVIRDAEIDRIKEFINNYADIRLERTDVSLNDTVKITAGTLQDKEGTIVNIRNNIVRVALPSLGFAMYADIEKSNITILQQNHTSLS